MFCCIFPSLFLEVAGLILPYIFPNLYLGSIPLLALDYSLVLSLGSLVFSLGLSLTLACLVCCLWGSLMNWLLLCSNLGSVLSFLLLCLVIDGLALTNLLLCLVSSPCVLASVLLATLLYCLLFCFVSWHFSFSCLGLSYLLSIACSHEVASLVFWLSCVLWDLALSWPCLLVSLMSWLLTPLGSWLLSSHMASALVVILSQVISFPLLPSLVSCASV